MDATPIIVVYNRICYNLKKALTKHHPKEPQHYTTILRKIEMLLSELLTKNQSIAGQLNKVETEIVKRIDDLQAAVDKLTQQLADVELTDEQTASIEELQTAVDALDNLTPDSDPVPNPEV